MAVSPDQRIVISYNSVILSERSESKDPLSPFPQQSVIPERL
jgi:hypothetical protein